MKPFWVYIVRCADGSYYTGHTEDLDKRISEHQTGAIPGCYTFERRPVTLVFSQPCATREEALASERQIKGWSRKKKEAMMRGDWNEVSRLAQNTLRQAQGERDSVSVGDEAIPVGGESISVRGEPVEPQNALRQAQGERGSVSVGDEAIPVGGESISVRGEPVEPQNTLRQAQGERGSVPVGDEAIPVGGEPVEPQNTPRHAESERSRSSVAPRNK